MSHIHILGNVRLKIQKKLTCYRLTGNYLVNTKTFQLSQHVNTQTGPIGTSGLVCLFVAEKGIADSEVHDAYVEPYSPILHIPDVFLNSVFHLP